MKTLEDQTALQPPLMDRRKNPAVAPSLWAAAGLIALYFLLQAVVGECLGFALGLATGFVRLERGIQPIGEEIRRMLAQPGMPAILVMLTLGVAATSIILLTRKKWPELWSQAMPPGLGVLLPENRAFFLLAILLGLAAPLIGGLLTSLLAHGQTVTQDIQNLGTSTPIALRVALVIVVASVGPFVEELLFRGVLLSALMQRFSEGWSMAISALLFSLVHLPSMQWQWFALPDLALLALAVAWLRLRASSLWPAVLAHSINNLLAVVVWFVAAAPT
jgi:membrane protease YdiL (CAAX protease family)